MYRRLSKVAHRIGMGCIDGPVVEKAIRDSDLGLNPISEGGLIRVPISDLSEERRKDMVKVAGRYAEACKVAMRNIRRDGIETSAALKKMG